MSKTSSINEFIQQLDTLSLEQLLEVREKVNALIKEKALESALYPDARSPIVVLGQPGAGKSTLLARLLGAKLPKDVDVEDETLEDAIKLVEEWMSDESGYDEETYPQIDAALNQNRLSS